MPGKGDVLYGSLGLMVMKTLEALGPLHGYRIARRIEQISGDHLALNQGTLYPALHRLENRGWLSAEWKESDTGREAKFYKLTRKGRAQLSAEQASWHRLSDAVGLILAEPEGEPL